MENQDSTQKIREAIKIAKGGDLKLARQMITEIVDVEPENEQALLAYAFIAPNVLEAEQVLEEILRINPNNTTALKQLAKLREQNSHSTDTFNNSQTPASPFTEHPSSKSPFRESPTNSAAFTEAPVYEEPSTNPTGVFASLNFTDEHKPIQDAFAHQEHRKVPCIQCGRPVDEGKTYCDQCKQEMEIKKLAINNPQTAANYQALEKKLDQLIVIQEEQTQQLKKVSRAAQLYFWITIIGFILSIVYICFVLFGLTSLLGGSTGFDFPIQ